MPAAPGSVDQLLAQFDLPVPATTLVVNGGTSDDADHPEAKVSAGRITGVDGTALEPHHSHALMVDAETWGGEISTMLDLCRALDQRGRAVALVAGGGRQTRVEIDGHRADPRPVIILAGTGRLADELASSGRTAGLSVVQVDDVDAVRVVVARHLT